MLGLSIFSYGIFPKFWSAAPFLTYFSKTFFTLRYLFHGKHPKIRFLWQEPWNNYTFCCSYRKTNYGKNFFCVVFAANEFSIRSLHETNNASNICILDQLGRPYTWNMRLRPQNRPTFKMTPFLLSLKGNVLLLALKWNIFWYPQPPVIHEIDELFSGATAHAPRTSNVLLFRKSQSPNHACLQEWLELASYL